MALTAVDRKLIQRCLQRDTGAWNDFVDRFLGAIYHVIDYTAHLRNVSLDAMDKEDVAAEVLLQIVANDFAVLRQFRERSSLGTYLAVIARRITVQKLIQRAANQSRTSGRQTVPERESDDRVLSRAETVEHVQKLIKKLPAKERDVVRMRFLEGHSYEEISRELGIPVSSIGPVLSRAKQRLREDGVLKEPEPVPTRRASNPSGRLKVQPPPES